MSQDAQTRVVSEAEADSIKHLIIEAASGLYEKKGLHQTSVEEIAADAGISVPVTYHYVRRKSDIMLLIMEAFTRKFQERILPQLDQLKDPADKLKKALEVFFNLVDECMIKVILVYRESRTLDKDGRKKIMAAEMEHVKIFQQILEEGIAQGRFSSMDTDLIAHNMIIAGHTWALKNWHYKKRLPLPDYLRLQTAFFLKAVSI